MALLRGIEQVWKAASVSAGTEVSASAFIGAGPNAAVYIKNSGAQPVTLKVQAAFPAGGKVSAGRNIDPTDWFDLQGFTSVAVAAGANVALNISPYAPPYLRLALTTAPAGATTLDAWVGSTGVG